MPSKPTLLILDYPGRRPEAHICDLDLEGLGFDCRYLLTRPLPGEVSTVEYARRLTERSGLPERGAVAVLSYCAAAPLAAAVAKRIAPEAPPPVVFFDPSRCHEYHIVNGYASVVRQIDGGEPGARGRPLLDVGPRIGRPALLIRQIADDLRDRARTALMAEGFDEQEAAEPAGQVVEMYVEWLTYLLAVHHRPASAAMGQVLHVISRRHPDDLGWLATGDVRTLRIDCDRPALARSERTRDAVRAFLEQFA